MLDRLDYPKCKIWLHHSDCSKTFQCLFLALCMEFTFLKWPTRPDRMWVLLFFFWSSLSLDTPQPPHPIPFVLWPIHGKIVLFLPLFSKLFFFSTKNSYFFPFYKANSYLPFRFQPYEAFLGLQSQQCLLYTPRTLRASLHSCLWAWVLLSVISSTI